jgi:Pyruvate/2-oxoacid:ferredoxin oxidoreductase delta subunit
MRIFIISSGEYGSKIVNGIANNGFAEKIIGIHEFPPKEDLPEFIDEFTTVFGKPKFEIHANEIVKSVKVIRGAPCGSSWYIAENIIGTPVDDAEFEANNKLHNYPCSSSMIVDNSTGDTILHLASYKTKEAIKRTLGFTNRAAVVDEEICEGSGTCEHFCLDACPNVIIGGDTITLNEDGKAHIDPGSCGVCEICVKECPYGVIEIWEEKIPVEKNSQ